MKVESPLELSVLNDRPSSSTDRVHFVLPFPGKFQTCCLLVGLDAIINVPMDGTKLKLSQIILSEGEIPWHNEVDVVLILLLHLDNPPCSPILMTHGVLLYRRLHTLRAYFFSTLLRNVANALANWVLFGWSMRYSLAVASKAFPRCWRASTL